MYRNVVTEMSPDRNGPDRNGSDRNDSDRDGQTESVRPKSPVLRATAGNSAYFPTFLVSLACMPATFSHILLW